MQLSLLSMLGIHEDTLSLAMRELAQRYADGLYHDVEKYGQSDRWYAVVIDGIEYLAAVGYKPSKIVQIVFDGQRPFQGQVSGVGLPFYNVCLGLRDDGAEGCMDEFNIRGKIVEISVVSNKVGPIFFEIQREIKKTGPM